MAVAVAVAVALAVLVVSFVLLNIIACVIVFDNLIIAVFRPIGDDFALHSSVLRPMWPGFPSPEYRNPYV